MEKTWRWFGKKDKITLAMLRQIGVEGIVTALHDVPLGQVWTREKIRDLREYIESYGMRWSVVESLPVVETIKYAGPDRDEQIEVYKQSLRNLSAEGIHTICYNFMPVLDWARTDLFHANPNGSTNLYFNYAEFAYFDIYILKRPGAREEWAQFRFPEGVGEGRNVLAEADELAKTMTPEKDHKLVETIVIKTQGFVSGNFSENDEAPVQKFREFLDLYKGIDKATLRANMKYFLEAIMPVCEECGMNMCVHPDDPPIEILGLPRIVRTEEDIEWFLNAVPNKHNGLTFCAGSLSAGAYNDVVGMARKFASRTHFVHLRSCHIFPNGDFTEASHLGGRADLVELVRIFEKENPALPMRVDHGMTFTDVPGGIMDESAHGHNAGYTLLGRMFAMGQVQGIIATVDRELGLEYKQPGFFDYIMKLTDILSGRCNPAEWEAKGYRLPKFDIAAVKAKTFAEPTWVHFGGGNIFRAFPAAILNDALNTGKYDRGVIVAETFDFEVIDKAYAPYGNLSLSVSLRSDGTIDKSVIASVTEALKADYAFPDWQRLVDIFRNPSLQMISFTITEKGYTVAPADLERGLKPVLAMGKVAALLYERWLAGALPLTVQSMDNCSHNGDKVKAGVLAYAKRWAADGLVPADFPAYLEDETKVTFPWSMIDKITPRPHEKVKAMLAADGFEDNEYIETEKHTFTAPFVNSEEVQYLVIEDNYTNGRPPLDLGGALYTTRETVDKVETMKVTTCLNPLHTAMSLYGCLLGYTLISAETADPDIRSFIQKIGYIEAMPVVTDPGVLNPYEFIGTVINRRLPNPFMPDAPQRIAMDTSQKLPIRFGETLKKYVARGLDKDNLVLIPLTLAGYARYLKGIRDDGTPFEPSPDPLLAELMAIVAPLEIGKPEQDWSCLKKLFSRKDIFAVDLYEIGLGERIEGMVRELYAAPGAVRKTLHKYVVAR